MSQAFKGVNRTAVVAWSPAEDQAGLLATATAAGSLDADFDSSAYLELFDVDAKSSERSLVKKGRAEINERAYQLAWGAAGSISPLGLIAASLDGGSIGIFDPAKLLNDSQYEPLGAELMLSNPNTHKTPVASLDFNPKRPILASGAENAEVFIWDLNKYTDPSGYAPGTCNAQPGNVSCLKWNTQSEFILATAYQDGRVLVWDLRKKRPIVTVPGNSFRDRITSCRSISWSPHNALELVIASDDDSKPVVQLWNLKKPHIPEKVLTGHTKGIWSTSWCPQDSKYLLSTSKDNRTICWNMEDGSIATELPGTNSEHNFNVQWSPLLPAVLSTASYDGQIRVYSLHDPLIASQSEYSANEPSSFASPPAWLARPAGASFAFGGKLLKVATGPAGSPQQVSVSSMQTQPELVARTEQLFNELEGADYSQYCSERAAAAGSEQLKDAWSYISALFAGSMTESILEKLGFSETELNAAVEAIKAGEVTAEVSATEEAPVAEKKKDDDVANLFDGEDAASFDDLDGDTADPFADVEGADDPFANFGEGGAYEGPEDETDDLGANSSFNAGYDQHSIVDLATRVETPIQFLSGNAVDSAIAKAVITGRHSLAVDLCVRNDRMADALMLAFSSNDESLIRSTREKYFTTVKRSHFMHTLSYVVKGDLRQLVARANTEEWKCTLAILCTYAQEGCFSSLCSDLGRLLQHVGNLHGALLCFVCAKDLASLASLWPTVAAEGQSGTDGLFSLVEMASVFVRGAGFTETPSAIADKYCEFAELLAAQGAMDLAGRVMNFVGANGNNPRVAELLERLNYEAPPAPAQQQQEEDQAPQQERLAAPQPVAPQQAPAHAAPQQQFQQQAQQAVYGQQPAQSQQYSQAQPQYGQAAYSPFAAQQAAAAPFANFEQAQPVQPVQPVQPAAQAVAPSFAPESVVYSGFSQPTSVFTPSRAAALPAPTSAPAANVAPAMPGFAPAATAPVAAAAPVPAPEQLPEEIFKDPEGKEEVDRLQAFVEALKQEKAADGRAVKTLDDCAKRLQALHGVLRKGGVSVAGLEAFKSYVAAAESRDSAALAAALGSLTATHYEEFTARVMLGLKKVKNVCS